MRPPKHRPPLADMLRRSVIIPARHVWLRIRQAWAHVRHGGQTSVMETAQTEGIGAIPAMEPYPMVDYGRPPCRGLNLFWRTFAMLALLMILSATGWLLTLRTLELEPRARQTAQQITTLVNITRTALVYADPISRFYLINTLAMQEGLRIEARVPDDQITLISHDSLDERVIEELRSTLGSSTIVASSVNDIQGLWIGFEIGHDAYWLLADQSRLMPVAGTTWLIWMLMAGSLSLVGAALIAGRVTQPLRQLSLAIQKIHKGELGTGSLNENATTKEIRDLNIGFNRMTEQLARVEQERTVMLAGISHDLRTPLARLRLEAEMSVPDENARNDMVADIEQVEGIINKFMDYARPDARQPVPVELAGVVQTCAHPYRNAENLRLNIYVPPELVVMADEIELRRVVSNFIENARRYGQTPGHTTAEVDIVAKAENNHRIHLQIADHGAGVPADILGKLTQPFYRADQARTAAAGSGLGLAIVKKIIDYMDGTLTLTNRKQGGLQADIMLPAGKL